MSGGFERNIRCSRLIIAQRSSSKDVMPRGSTQAQSAAQDPPPQFDTTLDSRNTTMTTRASNIANRLRQIRDRSRPSRPQDLRPRHRRLPGQQHLHGQVPRLFQVPSLEIQDLRHPQIGATHDERRGA